MNGKGVYLWANGNVYTGDFKDDKSDGHGVYHSIDGDSYEGDY
jgi:hypothetical protein